VKEWRLEIAVVVALIAMIGLLVLALVLEAQRWEAFKVAHNCKKVAHISGSTFNTFGVGTNGQVVIGVGSIPSKTGWQCDDGMTYYR